MKGGYKMTTGEKLRFLRQDRPMSDIASACKIARCTYNLYELDRRVPNDSIKVALAKYFGRSVQEIFFDEELQGVTRTGD